MPARDGNRHPSHAVRHPLRGQLEGVQPTLEVLEGRAHDSPAGTDALRTGRRRREVWMSHPALVIAADAAVTRLSALAWFEAATDGKGALSTLPAPHASRASLGGPRRCAASGDPAAESPREGAAEGATEDCGEGIGRRSRMDPVAVTASLTASESPGGRLPMPNAHHPLPLACVDATGCDWRAATASAEGSPTLRRSWAMRSCTEGAEGSREERGGGAWVGCRAWLWSGAGILEGVRSSFAAGSREAGAGSRGRAASGEVQWAGAGGSTSAGERRGQGQRRLCYQPDR